MIAATAGLKSPRRRVAVSSRVRLRKTPEDYFAVRESRKELPYEAILASGRTSWSVGDRVRVHRKRKGQCGLLEESEDGPARTSNIDDRGYDVDHYARQLRQTFPTRLECAFTPADYESLFANPDQMSLFMPAIATIRNVLERKAETKADAFSISSEFTLRPHTRRKDLAISGHRTESVYKRYDIVADTDLRKTGERLAEYHAEQTAMLERMK